MPSKKSRSRASTRKAVAKPGLHPVFGPVADPGPWIEGLDPLVDRAPPFWRSIADRVQRSSLAAEDQKALTELRLRRVNASVQALEAQAAIAEEEFQILSRKGVNTTLDDKRFSPPGLGGDPAPELSPIDKIRFLHDLRMSALRRTVQYLKDAAKAIEAAR